MNRRPARFWRRFSFERLSNPASVGESVASVLSGAWRPSPPPLYISERQLERVAPALLRKRAGGIGWWRIRGGTLSESPAGVELHQAFRLHALHAAIYEAQTKQTVNLLISAGIEALVVKGWTVSRLYPAPGLRPYGDVDVLVAPDQFHQAKTLLQNRASRRPPTVDLHSTFPYMPDRPFDELYARSSSIPLGQTLVRTLGPEDHLRLLCLHFLKHGGVSPIWLADVAAFVETTSDGLDWDRLLAGRKKDRNRVLAVIGLAHRVLGARFEGPSRDALSAIPRWMAPAMLREWGTVLAGIERDAMSFFTWPASFGELIVGLRRRWPNPLYATVWWDTSLNDRRRLPFQLGTFAARVGGCFPRLITHVRNPNTALHET